MKRSTQRRDKRRSGAALAEYGLLVAGVTLAAMVAVSVLGGKVGGLVASVATLLPGATPQDNGIVQVGNLIETTYETETGVIRIDDQVMLHQKSGLGRARGLGEVMGLKGEAAIEASHLYQLGDREIDE